MKQLKPLKQLIRIGYLIAAFAVFAVVFALGCPIARSADKAEAVVDIVDKLDKLKAQLQSQMDAEIKEIKRSPLPGWYEVNLNSHIFYSDAQGRYLLVGDLIDLKTHKNLTAERLDDLNQIDFARLPLTDAIKVVNGNGARQIAIFSDPNCPYCEQLEKSLTKLKNVTLYTFLYPVLSDDSMIKAKAVWCAANRSSAWKTWMVDKKLPSTHANANANCDTQALQKNIALGRELKVTGTPTIFAENGRRLSGAVSADALEMALASAHGGSQHAGQ